MNFDDIFEELEAKFEALLLKQRSTESSNSADRVAVTLISPLALPKRGQPQSNPPARTVILEYASIGSDCLVGFGASLDYWLILRLDSISEIRFLSSRSSIQLHLSGTDISFDSLVAGLDLPREAWVRRGQDSRLLKGQLTAQEQSLLRLGFGTAAHFVPAASVTALVIPLSD